MVRVSISIVPVLDVMGGFVVHAVRGEREKYRPFTDSVLCRDASPTCVIDRLHDMGFRAIYVADLDSIMGVGNNRWVIDYALKRGFKVYADVGRVGISSADEEYLHYVIGTEYLVYPHELRIINGRVASLDLEYEKVKFTNGVFEVEDVLDSIKNMGVSPMALLLINLKYVGTMQGINRGILERVRSKYGGKLLVGGGLSGPEEVRELVKYGLDGLLVATTIHKGLIKTPYLEVEIN